MRNYGYVKKWHKMTRQYVYCSLRKHFSYLLGSSNSSDDNEMLSNRRSPFTDYSLSFACQIMCIYCPLTFEHTLLLW